MKTNNRMLKVAIDMTWVQLMWSAVFMFIVFVVYVGMHAMGGNVEFSRQAFHEFTFLSFVFNPARIFLLIVGISSVSGFLTFFVRHGITRKDYFYGAVLSTILITLLIHGISGMVSAVEHGLFNPLEVESEMPIIATVLINTLQTLVYFGAGWMIGAGFYRFGSDGRLLYVLLAAAFVLITILLWETRLSSRIPLIQEWFPSGIPYAVSIGVTGALFLLSCVVVRLTTRRVRIKI